MAIRGLEAIVRIARPARAGPVLKVTDSTQAGKGVSSKMETWRNSRAA
jgi:hypothetical protein